MNRLRLILAESLSISVLGSILGTLGAVGLTRFLTSLPKVNGLLEGRLSWSIILTGLALSFVVGTLGAAWPAWHGASLLPTDAMRR